MAVCVYTLTFFCLFLSTVTSVNCYKVFTYSDAEVDETTRPMKLDKANICSVARSNLSTHSLDLLIIVNSAVGNFGKRAAIRDTWGRVVRQQNVPLLFLLGSTQAVHLQLAVEREDSQFGDLIQTPVVDSYQNITLKTIAMLRFVSLNCAQAVKWLLKIDDDMLLHPQRIIDFAHSASCPGTILGRLGNSTPVSNPINSTHKNYCPVECYQDKLFPRFLTGGTVLLDSKLAQPMYLYAMGHHDSAAVVEDVFMFGIVPQALNISRIGFYGLDYESSEYDRIFPSDLCAFTKHFSTEQSNIQRFRNLWHKFNQSAGEAISCKEIPDLQQVTKCY